VFAYFIHKIILMWCLDSARRANWAVVAVCGVHLRSSHERPWASTSSLPFSHRTMKPLSNVFIKPVIFMKFYLKTRTERRN